MGAHDAGFWKRSDTHGVSSRQQRLRFFSLVCFCSGKLCWKKGQEGSKWSGSVAKSVCLNMELQCNS